MGGCGGKYTVARYIVGQYDISSITDSKQKIVDFYKWADQNNAIRVDTEMNAIRTKKGTQAKAQELANELAERIEVRDTQAIRDFKDLKDFVGNTPFTISAYDRQNIPDFGDYAKSRDNFVRIAREGSEGSTRIDTLYQELEERYPHYFDSHRNSNPADQLLDINRVMKRLRTGRVEVPKEYKQAAANELKSMIIKSYLATKNDRKKGA